MYDLNIENYNEKELLKMLGVKESINKIKKEYVEEHVKNLKKKVLNENYENKDNVLFFLDKTNEKLLMYIKKRDAVQLVPTNYEILQSKNELSGGTHAVTSEKIIQVLNTNEYKYPVGVLNPLEKRAVSKVINIDTVFRKDYDKSLSNNFIWVLPQPESNVVSMKLSTVELPVMWYDISEIKGNNKFKVKLYNMKRYQDSVKTISVPSGNYNNIELQDIINSKFKLIGEGLNYLIINISDTTTKTSIHVVHISEQENGLISPYDPNLSEEYSPLFNYEIYFSWDDAYNIRDSEFRYRRTLGWYMGFKCISYTVWQSDEHEEYEYKKDVLITYKGYLLSESSFGNGKLHYLYISVDDYNNNCLTETICSYTGDVFIGNNLLGRISVDAASNDVMIYGNTNDRIFKQRDYLGPITLSKLHIKLLDKFGDVIDMNNNDYSLTLELTKLY